MYQEPWDYHSNPRFVSVHSLFCNFKASVCSFSLSYFVFKPSSFRSLLSLAVGFMQDFVLCLQVYSAPVQLVEMTLFEQYLCIFTGCNNLNTGVAFLFIYFYYFLHHCYVLVLILQYYCNVLYIFYRNAIQSKNALPSESHRASFEQCPCSVGHHWSDWQVLIWKRGQPIF